MIKQGTVLPLNINRTERFFSVSGTNKIYMLSIKHWLYDERFRRESGFEIFMRSSFILVRHRYEQKVKLARSPSSVDPKYQIPSKSSRLSTTGVHKFSKNLAATTKF
jgi:hypothetical protein